MPLEWLLIIIPVVFGLGWFAARLDIRHIRNSAAELPRAYLRGLTELLNGNEDKALDSFSNIAPVDTLPPELQFTVGELSRRRGDYQRALRTHQQLQADERLNETDRNRALWELAKDCAAMGFSDAAEQYARLLAETPGYRDRVFNFLLKNYQSRRRYRNALTLIENIADEETRRLHRKTAAHLLCQLARSDETRCTELLNQALAIDPTCARARHQLAQQALAAGQPQQALDYCLALANDTPDYVWLTAETVTEAYEQMQDAGDGRKILLRWLEQHPSPLLLAETMKILARQINAAADETVRNSLNACRHKIIDDAVSATGTMESAVYYIEARISDEATPGWLAAQKILLNACRKALICTDCAYEMNSFSWQCPCCLRWESFRQQ